MNKPIYFFYSGLSELLKTKPENITAVDATSPHARQVLEDIGMTGGALPCFYIRSSGRYFDHQNNREYILPEAWKHVSLSGVTRWEEVNLQSTSVVEETVVEEQTVVVEPVVVEPVVEETVVVEPVVEETVVEPVVEETVVEPVVEESVVLEPVVEPVVEETVE